MKDVPLFTRILEESITLKNDCREDPGVCGEINPGRQLMIEKTCTLPCLVGIQLQEVTLKPGSHLRHNDITT